MQAIKERGNLLIDYFRNKPTNDDVKKVRMHDNDKVAGIVDELLMEHCEECQIPDREKHLNLNEMYFLKYFCIANVFINWT